MTDRIRRGKYTPKPVRRVEIPKPDGGVRKLGNAERMEQMPHQEMKDMAVIYRFMMGESPYGEQMLKLMDDCISRKEAGGVLRRMTPAPADRNTEGESAA